MRKIFIIFFTFFTFFSFSIKAKTIYLDCEETVSKLNQPTFEFVYEEGKIVGNNFVKIKKKSVDIYFKFTGGEAYPVFQNKKFKKNKIGFKVQLELDTKDIKAEEYYSFISLSDRYVFNRKSFVWYAETEEDEENIVDYESQGSCIFIDKSEFKSLVKD